MAKKLVTSSLTDDEKLLLAHAYRNLEHPSLAARLTSVVGTPIEIAFHLLPKHWYEHLHVATERSVGKALDVAVSSLHPSKVRYSQDHYHQTLGMMSGALGGFFGLPALLVELPVTTTIMLRSVADIARREGEDLNSLETRLACMQVFALGARSEEDDAADTGYYGIRLALASSLSNTSKYIMQNGIASEGAPIIVRLISLIASRFGVAISQKTAAQIIPVLGAAGGAMINAIFMKHFQDAARGHFAVRRLERKYGPDLVRKEYEALTLTEAKAA